VPEWPRRHSDPADRCHDGTREAASSTPATNTPDVATKVVTPYNVTTAAVTHDESVDHDPIAAANVRQQRAGGQRRDRDRVLNAVARTNVASGAQPRVKHAADDTETDGAPAGRLVAPAGDRHDHGHPERHGARQSGVAGSGGASAGLPDYITLERKAFVRSCCGLPRTSRGLPRSTMTPASMNTS
jgi:hypothetical protein